MHSPQYETRVLVLGKKCLVLGISLKSLLKAQIKFEPGWPLSYFR